MSNQLQRWLVAAVTAAILGPSATSTQSQEHHHSDQQERDAEGQPGSITGWIRDAACLFRNPAGSAPSTPETLDCAQKCVKGGSPLVVLTPDGNLYFVISETIPDVSQQERLFSYVGKFVKVSGRLFERAGSHGIAIQNLQVIEASKSRSPAAASTELDVASIDGILRALYEVVSGPAGPRDWKRGRKLFLPEARLMP